jgi:hypothetical protein
LCPGRGAFASVPEAKSKGCFALINKPLVDFVFSKQMEIAEYNSQQAKVKPESDAVSKRLDGIKDRLAKKSDH